MTHEERLAKAKEFGKLQSESVRAEIAAEKSKGSPNNVAGLLKRVELLEKLMGV
ncbi:MAG: hypothetical protein GT601_17560 [Acidaminobacter sp.]|uniref:hypothetical protein n=1 Tax=Acidaminobacter sp. TaxID=1872102 RepID=UPI00137E84E9|nr:hypothetical protein [Acidaminobacter sp.]MZQ99477.1 hypothetical protein [Acidaminobacter sp.]